MFILRVSSMGAAMRKFRSLVVALVLASVLALPAWSQSLDKITEQPSFDFGKAATTIEQAICGDNLLAQWDAKMGQLFRQAQSIQANRRQLTNEQRQWIALRQSKCISSDPSLIKSCILEMTKARVGGLAAVVAAAIPPAPDSNSAGNTVAALPGPTIRGRCSQDYCIWMRLVGQEVVSSNSEGRLVRSMMARAETSHPGGSYDRKVRIEWHQPVEGPAGFLDRRSRRCRRFTSLATPSASPRR
jgi:uncharacterized protein